LGGNERARDGGGGHCPKPLQGVLAGPRGCINVAHGSLPSQGGHGLIVGHEGVRDPVEDFLHRPEAERDGQDRGTAILHEAP
jgi:hypothetical protein